MQKILNWVLAAILTDNSILENPEIKAAFGYAKQSGKSLHLMGLTSTGGIHSSLDHLLKLLDIAQMYDIPNCYVHCFMDGLDTDAHSGKGFIADVQRHLDELGTGVIATAIGRYYAMDRDQHWDRIKLAYDLLVSGQGRAVTDMVAGVQSCYDSHTEEHKNTDQFLEPLVNINDDGTPNTTHSTNPVPFIYVTDSKSAKVQGGALCDVAPSILHIMGLPQPGEMTGKCLIQE